MESIIVLEFVGVLFAWTVAAFAIWKWGPGLRKRSVPCPTKKARAQVLAEQTESEFGCLHVADVRNCSLLPGKPLDCGKECLSHF
jgi:hypothetical protein